ncbi:MAG TPA: hypothetical protein PL190_07025 [Caldisericia bacterium]|nr:MAG: hypothetical protein BWX90_00942 [bacterium ADurb.Bin132]HNW31312.1 hypothetical protein [Caldisericia bacterium]HNY61893.1 hypothetical protein [Caldisericia bacterium]HOC80022.1 hypothetical protein [Caldisericia bacterium]HOG70868.1 hypothetical protein [Caldisericia bacterium]
MVTYELVIDEPDIWFVQSVLDTADNICIVDKTNMVGPKGHMKVMFSEEAEKDFLYLVEKLWQCSSFTYERI